MEGMVSYRQAAVERAMKVQEVILRAMAKKITWWQAAEIIGISDRQMRRWRERYEEFGFRGLFDRRRGKPSPKRVAVAVVEKVLGLYREKYFDLNVRHFHEKLQEEHPSGKVVPNRTGKFWQSALAENLYAARQTPIRRSPKATAHLCGSGPADCAH